MKKFVSVLMALIMVICVAAPVQVKAATEFQEVPVDVVNDIYDDVTTSVSTEFTMGTEYTVSYYKFTLQSDSYVYPMATVTCGDYMEAYLRVAADQNFASYKVNLTGSEKDGVINLGHIKWLKAGTYYVQIGTKAEYSWLGAGGKEATQVFSVRAVAGNIGVAQTVNVDNTVNVRFDTSSITKTALQMHGVWYGDRENDWVNNQKLYEKYLDKTSYEYHKSDGCWDPQGQDFVNIPENGTYTAVIAFAHPSICTCGDKKGNGASVVFEVTGVQQNTTPQTTDKNTKPQTTDKNTTPQVTDKNTTPQVNTVVNKPKVTKARDTKKPTIKGVKNGKTYRKKVTIKFSDKSGIRSARLNGKKIKSGKKVSKKGSYKLVVIDKAGNIATVKFKIKK